MTEIPLKTQVKEILLNHRGRGRAIKGQEIAQKLGFKDDRQVRLIIRDLIADGIPIASGTESPAGFYLVENKDEADIYMDDLRSRLKEIAIRRWQFRLAAKMSLEHFIQLKLI